jgi:nucleoside-diphosphate-sugar epimerase
MPDVRQPSVAQDFIYVDDVAAGLVALAEAGDASGVFNLGTGVPTTVGHIANTVARHFGKPETFATDSQSGFWADTSRTHRVLGWRARTGIEEGIQRTLAAAAAVP